MNRGIFSTLREYFDEQRTNKVREIPFAEVLENMQFFFPNLTERKLQIYLHDKRQLKNVDYKAKRGTVMLK